MDAASVQSRKQLLEQGVSSDGSRFMAVAGPARSQPDRHPAWLDRSLRRQSVGSNVQQVRP